MAKEIERVKNNQIANYMSGEVLIYESPNGEVKFDTYIVDNDVWVNQVGLASLFQTTVANINKHIANIYAEGELDKNRTINSQLIVQNEGGREIKRKVLFYNLDMILAIGFRAKSSAGTQYRRWANRVLKEYAQKGFAMNDDRLKNPKDFGTDYYEELLARIRSIRASEKRFYEKVKQIYALSIDYSPNDEKAKEFFATVQNKLHYSVHGHTAAEIIYDRADSKKENMGLTTWQGADRGNQLKETDVVIAKNYLNENEIQELERIVVMYLDHAEDMARRNLPMHMADWKAVLDEFLKFKRRDILIGAGKISAELAKQKALKEYEIFDQKRISQAPQIEIESLVKECKKKKV